MIEMFLATALFWQSPPRSDPNFEKVIYLYEQPECVNGRCSPPHIVGGWMIGEAVFKTYDGGKWGEVAEPPIEPPVKRPPKRPNFGVDLAKGAPAYAVNGRKVTAQDAYKALQLTDDSGKPRLTLIDTQAEVPADLKSACLVWRTTRNHWSVEGFPDCAAILTTASGKKLYAGPADFAAIAKALDGTIPPDEPPLPTEPLPVGWIAVGLGVLILFWSRK